MVGEVIQEKVRNFYRLQRKVHITKIPTGKYPKGDFLNGYITDVLIDKINFLEDKNGACEVYFFEIADVELFKEKVDNGHTETA